MSDSAQGPNWWQASDGKWYPPESHPDFVVPPVQPEPQTGSPASSAPRSVWDRWWLAVVGLLLGFGVGMVVGAALDGSGDSDTESGGTLATDADDSTESADDDLSDPDVSTEPPAATSTPVPAPTATAAPTATTAPTPTPQPTSTPTATPTPEPSGFGPGTRIVGNDIEAGRYISVGGLDSCYWERLSGLGGSDEEVIANDTPWGYAQAIVDIEATDVAFNSTECGEWAPVSTVDLQELEVPEDGNWLVGDQIRPGVYRTLDEVDGCYWARQFGFDGGVSDIIVNDYLTEGLATVEVKASDAGLTVSGCGAWERIG